MVFRAPTATFPDLTAQSVRERLAEVAERHDLELIVLFGSRATGLAGPSSDTDLAVRAAGGPLEGMALMALQDELASALGGVRVDLVDLGTGDPLLLHRIFRDATALYEECDAFERERLRAFHRYEDYRPYLRLERAAVRRRLGLDDD